MAQRFLIATIAAMLACGGTRADDWLARYNIVWNDAVERFARLDAAIRAARRGANVWVQDGSIWLYLAHSGAYDEQGRLLKLGCVRITPVGRPAWAARASARNSTCPPARSSSSKAISRHRSGSPGKLSCSSRTPVTSRDRCRLRHLARPEARGHPLRHDGCEGNLYARPDPADTNGFAWFHRNADFPVT